MHKWRGKKASQRVNDIPIIYIDILYVKKEKKIICQANTPKIIH